jgi:hypothetical protein
MKKQLIALLILNLSFHGKAQDTTQVVDEEYPFNKQKGEPLDSMDCTWWNGGDRRSSPTLAGKYFTPTVMVDVNYTHSFNDPIDNTVVGSTALARNNEMQLSAAHMGGDFSYKGARAHIVTQFGTRSTVIPRNDYSPYKGQYNLAVVYRYLA